MVTCIQEHNKSHWSFRARVEVLKILSDLYKELRNIFNLYIWSIFTVNAIEVITKYNSFNIEYLIFSYFELFTFCQEEIEEDLFILWVDHSVTEYSLVFVDPKSHDINCGLGSLLIGGTDTLEDL